MSEVHEDAYGKTSAITCILCDGIVHALLVAHKQRVPRLNVSRKLQAWPIGNWAFTRKGNPPVNESHIMGSTRRVIRASERWSMPRTLDGQNILGVLRSVKNFRRNKVLSTKHHSIDFVNLPPPQHTKIALTVTQRASICKRRAGPGSHSTALRPPVLCARSSTVRVSP